MAGKKMVLTFYRQNHVRPDWQVDLSSPAFDLFLVELMDDLSRFGIDLERRITKRQ